MNRDKMTILKENLENMAWAEKRKYRYEEDQIDDMRCEDEGCVCPSCQENGYDDYEDYDEDYDDDMGRNPSQLSDEDLDERIAMLKMAEEMKDTDNKYKRIFSIVDVYKKLHSLEKTQYPSKGTMTQMDNLRILINAKEKRNVLATQEMVKDLDELETNFPNFSKVTQFIKKHIMFQAIKGQPISLPAINLQGPSGIGKTYFSEQIASILKTDSIVLSVSQLMSSNELLGLPVQWADPHKGRIAQMLLEETTYAQPVVLMDELCKTPTREGANQVHNTILKILDKKSAKKLVDNFLEFPIDASHAIYISTTNDWESLPSPLKSRILNFDISNPTKNEIENIIKNIYREKLEELGCEDQFHRAIPKETVDDLSNCDLRTVKGIVESAIMSSLIKHVAMKKRGKVKLTASDIQEERYQAKGRKDRSIGFI